MHRSSVAPEPGLTTSQSPLLARPLWGGADTYLKTEVVANPEQISRAADSRPCMNSKKVMSML
jgi:hypothetical protein